MWPLLIGLGAWAIAEGIRQGVREDREAKLLESRSRLERLPLTDTERTRYLEDGRRGHRDYRNRLS